MSGEKRGHVGREGVMGWLIGPVAPPLPMRGHAPAATPANSPFLSPSACSPCTTTVAPLGAGGGTCLPRLTLSLFLAGAMGAPHSGASPATLPSVH